MRLPRVRAGSVARWAIALSCAGSAAASACSDSSSRVLAPHDHLIVDVDATPPPPPLDAAVNGPDSPFGAVDAPYGLGAADVYGAVSVCDQCVCPSGSFCFGGGRGYPAFSGDCNAAPSGGGLAVGCNPLPGGCVNEPDCACILGTLGSALACDPNCAAISGFAVYCP